MKNILVTVDFEKNTGTLIDAAAMMAEKFGAKLWLIHAAAPDPDFVGYEPGPQSERDIRADKLRTEHKELQKVANELSSHNIEAEALLVQGPTIETILDEIKKLKADLVVIGYNEHSWLYNLWYGNTGSDLMKKSNVPLLVVPLH